MLQQRNRQNVMSGQFPEPGKLFEEKYRVEKLLGSGGFARVYLAEQIDLGRQVAIKVLSPKVAKAAGAEETDPQIEAVALRFEREARIVSQLKSAQTITMYDYGRTDDGLLYMVMEYVDGTELDEIPVPIEPRRVLTILRQVMQSLQEAHAHGLLHRDLKPANIMLYEHLGRKDQVKLLDFGIAKAVGQAANDNDKDLTAADSLIGTPRYMSPEQIRGQDIGPASDIYSVGLVTYELLMGEKAITNNDSIEILGKHLSAESFEIPPQHPIHPRLRRLVNKMLAKKIDDRYASTEAVLEDVAEIERIDGNLRLAGPPPTEGPTPVEELDFEELDEADLEFTESDGGSSRRRLVAAVVAVVLLGAVALALWSALGSSGDPKAVAIDEPAGAEAAAKAATGAQADEQPKPVVTLIRTRPSGASIWLADRLVGMSPVQFDSTDYDFPLAVRAKMGEQSVEKSLDEPGGEIWLELPRPEELVDSEDAGASEKAGQANAADDTAEPEARADSKPADSKPAEAKPAPKKPVRKKPARKTSAPSKASAKKSSSDKPSSDKTPTAKPSNAGDDGEEDVTTRKYLPLE